MKPMPEAPLPSSSVGAIQPVPDVDILTQTVAVSLNSLYGIYGVELWHFNEKTGKLDNIAISSDLEEGGSIEGLLLKRVTQDADEVNRKYYVTVDEPQKAFNKLTDKSYEGYLPPDSVGPGFGLAGALWSEVGLYASNGIQNIGASSPHHVHWREVDELANDPDQPYDERLQSLVRAGFVKAAGIPFNVKNYRGMVIYFANPYGDKEKLNNEINLKMIHHSSQLIGAAAAFRIPQEESESFLMEGRAQNWRRVKTKILTIMRFGGSLRAKKDGTRASLRYDRKNSLRMSRMQQMHQMSIRMKKDFKETIRQAGDEIKTKMRRWVAKMHGGNAGVPPSFTWSQTGWSFFGVFVTHMLLSRLNYYIVTETADTKALSLILAPFGAVTALQYNLTPAPASQPRVCFFAQLLAITVANLVSYIPLPSTAAWLRSAIAPAIVIPTMAKLGITHPPAGATSIVFSSLKNQWAQFGIFLCGVSITIVNAVLINNMSDKRQYPTSWPYLRMTKSKIGMCKNG